MENTDRDKKVFADRERTNLLKFIEQPTLLFLCKITPGFVTPDMLTAFGMFGSFTVLGGFLLARTNHLFLIVAILGFALNWVGDSLDGRIAYYRSTPRRWYGFALDVIMDWLSLVTMGMGYYYYINDEFKVLVFSFCCAYAWAMMIPQIRYKITDKYTIDSGLLGPTEVRVIICLVIFLELVFGGPEKKVFTIFSVVVNVILIVTNIVDTFKLLKLGDKRDQQERELKRVRDVQEVN